MRIEKDRQISLQCYMHTGEYRIGACQVMEEYLKDRKGRKLSLDEIDHYMKVAKAIRLTIELQEKVDEAYARID